MGAKCRAQRNQEDGKPAMANKKYWQGELTNVHQEVQQTKTSAEGFNLQPVHRFSQKMPD
jgi:hypothetical protein